MSEGVVAELKPNTLGEIAERQANLLSRKVVYQFEGRSTNYATFNRHTNQIAHALTAAGVKHGDRIAYLGKNTDFYFEILIGASKIGAVMVPINWRLARPEIAYILADCCAKVLFVGPELVDLVGAHHEEIPSVALFVAVEGNVGSWQSLELWRDSQPDTQPAVNIVPGDVAVQMYTSGTTGRPKGAMLTHESLLGLPKLAGDNQPEWSRWTEKDVGLVAMPVFHIGGTGFGMQVLIDGATGVIAREFDVNLVLDFIQRDRISKIFLVPSAMQIIVRNPRARDIDYSCIRQIYYGASPMPLELLRECIDVFGCGFVQMYGMTETSGTIVALPPEDHDPQGTPQMRSAGKPLLGVELAIFGENDEILPPHMIGEIATRSVANMAGYWNLPEATANALTQDGWLRTGDAGYLDEGGYLYIHDRVKDMIVSGGENVYPAEVENAIFGHPDVADVAVIGVPDEKWGEAVTAIVVLRPGRTLDSAGILTWTRSRIASFKVPKSILAADVLPRNASGKLLRRELRKPFWVGRDRQVN